MIIAISVPGPVELILVMLLLAVPAALVLLVLRGKRPGQARPTQPAFPVMTAAESDGPGRYRIVGVDKTTRADRELTLEAASRANAHVKAELEGVIVTSVAKQA